MGRYYFNTKKEADDLKKISIFWLKKNNFLHSWISGSINWTNNTSGKENNVAVCVSITDEDKYLKIAYTQTNADGEKKDFDYKIPITSTACNYGGVRYWFICPFTARGVYCGRRVAILYKGGDYFACRHCYDLTYYSKNKNRRFSYFPYGVLTLCDKAEKLAEKIKTPYYAGKPTRKQRRVEALCKRIHFLNKGSLI